MIDIFKNGVIVQPPWTTESDVTFYHILNELKGEDNGKHSFGVSYIARSDGKAGYVGPDPNFMFIFDERNCHFANEDEMKIVEKIMKENGYIYD